MLWWRHNFHRICFFSHLNLLSHEDVGSIFRQHIAVNTNWLGIAITNYMTCTWHRTLKRQKDIFIYTFRNVTSSRGCLFIIVFTLFLPGVALDANDFVSKGITWHLSVLNTWQYFICLCLHVCFSIISNSQVYTLFFADKSKAFCNIPLFFRVNWNVSFYKPIPSLKLLGMLKLWKMTTRHVL